MSKSSVLTLALILAIAIWLLSLVLFLHLSQYDPYSWAIPGQESDISRSLYLERSAFVYEDWYNLIRYGLCLGAIETRD